MIDHPFHFTVLCLRNIFLQLFMQPGCIHLTQIECLLYSRCVRSFYGLGGGPLLMADASSNPRWAFDAVPRLDAGAAEASSCSSPPVRPACRGNGAPVCTVKRYRRSRSPTSQWCFRLRLCSSHPSKRCPQLLLAFNAGESRDNCPRHTSLPNLNHCTQGASCHRNLCGDTHGFP